MRSLISVSGDILQCTVKLLGKTNKQKKGSQEERNESVFLSSLLNLLCTTKSSRAAAIAKQEGQQQKKKGKGEDYGRWRRGGEGSKHRRQKGLHEREATDKALKPTKHSHTHTQQQQKQSKAEKEDRALATASSFLSAEGNTKQERVCNAEEGQWWQHLRNGVQ